MQPEFNAKPQQLQRTIVILQKATKATKATKEAVRIFFSSFPSFASVPEQPGFGGIQPQAQKWKPQRHGGGSIRLLSIAFVFLCASVPLWFKFMASLL
jgi:hypothetical protein